MRKEQYLIFFGIALIFLLWGCSLDWSQAIRQGEIVQDNFENSVPIETEKGLLFIPVKISGKTYRFLLDSGAPFSISKQLQQEHFCPIISKGNIVDSDHNRKKVNWARVETLEIGEVSFVNQVAFVGDFQANPLLNCLDIDGIIGSNLMRHCNWTIDQQRKQLTLFSSMDNKVFENYEILDFKTDNQYNIFLDVGLGKSKIRNVLMDYGSNGELAVRPKIWKILEEKKEFGQIDKEIGSQQSGIVGKKIPLDRTISFIDTMKFGNLTLSRVMIRSGKTVSIGNGLLSMLNVTIDWKNHKLYIKQNAENEVKRETVGFKLGFTSDNEMIVMSVMESSNAFHAGVRSEMKVIKMDTLNFKGESSFCDYVNHIFKKEIFLQLENAQGEVLDLNFQKTTY